MVGLAFIEKIMHVVNGTNKSGEFLIFSTAAFAAAAVAAAAAGLLKVIARFKTIGEVLLYVS